MKWILNNPAKCKVRENKGKLSLIIESVASIHEALGTLDKITIFLDQYRNE
jgi:hypothetical protein